MIDVPEPPILTYEGKTVIYHCKSWKVWSVVYNEYKMSPTSISGGGKLLTGGELISLASLKR